MIQYIFLVFFVGMLMSCGVDEFDDVKVETEVFEPEVVYVNDLLTKARSVVNSDVVKIECTTVKFPFKLIDFTQNTYTINTIETFNHLVSDSSIQIIDFVYPLQIIDNLGIEKTANSLWDFAEYAAGCYPQTLEISNNLFPAYVINETNSCYTIKYPLTLSKTDGSLIVVQDERTFIQKHASESLNFVFPFTLTNPIGETFMVKDADSLLKLLLNCNLWPIIDSTSIQINAFNFFACYELIFPLKVKIIGNTTPLIINNSEMFGNVLVQGRFESFIFPILLKASDGTIWTANNDEELNQLIDACFTSGDFIFLLLATPLFSDMPCYDLIFPFKVKTSNVQTIVQNYNQIDQMIQDSMFNQYNIEYPVAVKFKANGQQKTLLNIDDVLTTLNDCN